MFEHAQDVTNQTIVSNVFWTNTMSYIYGEPTGVITISQWNNINTVNTTNDALYASNNIVMPQGPPPIIASNATVGGTFSVLQAAVDAASAGDEIRVRDMVLTRNIGQLNALSVTNALFITNKNDLRIIGGYDAAFAVQTGYTVLDGEGVAPDSRIVFITNLANLTFNGFVIRNGGTNGGVTSQHGTGLYIYSAVSSLFTNIIVSNCTSVNGGGVYINYSTNLMLYGDVVNNTASYGGGIYVTTSTNNTVSGFIASNTANRGGGIYMNGGAHNSMRGMICSNSAVRGGGLFVYGGSNSIVQSCIFSNNVSSATNATILFTNVTALAPFTVSNSVFYGGGSGSCAILEEAPDITNHTICSNTFWTNTLSYLYIESGDQIISNDRIDILNSNSTWHDAANASMNVVMPLLPYIAKITNTGGQYTNLQEAVAAAVAGNEIRVLATNLTRNAGQLNALALTNGVSITNKNNLRIIGGYDAAFAVQTGHTVLDGGGLNRTNRLVYIANLTDLLFDGFVIRGGGSNETAKILDGTGVHASNIAFSILSNIIVSNCISSNGGGMSIANASNCLISALVANNVSTNVGGGMSIDSCSFVTIRGLVSNNTGNDGGGLSIQNATNCTVDATLAGNNASVAGGGVFMLSCLSNTISAPMARNTALNGGGVRIKWSYYSTVSGAVVSNSAGDNGGGVYLFYETNSSITG
ncbi:MAG: right-handed parallel beta-helix repeat-containing protein, partial [Spirochaetota bacterium]